MLYFVTENQEKFNNANIILKNFSLQLQAKKLDIIEIQSDSLEKIAEDKARQAYTSIRQPLVVKDDGWYIPSLNGFPGSYMKYMNQWLSPDDFLNLLRPYKDKEIIFKDALCYVDATQQKIFTNTIHGYILNEPKGEGVSMARLATFRKDGKTMAECINKNIHFADEENSVWNEFGKWYRKIS